MALITVIPPEQASGALAETYHQLSAKRGKVARILQAHSLRPSALTKHVDLYLDLLFEPGPLSRAEREAIAVAVSRENGCDYCVAHHAEPLSKYIRDAATLGALANGETPEGLSPRIASLVAFARGLTRNPSAAREVAIQQLRDAGFDDEAILLATLVTAYFNFVNRIALGLGVETDDVEVTGYRDAFIRGDVAK